MMEREPDRRLRSSLRAPSSVKFEEARQLSEPTNESESESMYQPKNERSESRLGPKTLVSEPSIMKNCYTKRLRRLALKALTSHDLF